MVGRREEPALLAQRGRPRGRRPATNSAAPGPDSSARARNGGNESSRRSASSASSNGPGVPRHRRPQHLVVGQPGLHRDHARPRGAASADQPAGPGQQGERLLARREPGREQVEVEVQEGHHRGPADPVQHRLGARPRPARRGPAPSAGPATSATSTPSSASSSSRTRVTPGRSTFIFSRPQDAQTPAARAPQAGQTSRPSCSARPTARSARSVRDLAAVRAGEQLRPAPAVEDRHGPAPGPPAASRTSSSEYRPVRGSAPRRSITCSARPPGPLGRPGQRRQPARRAPGRPSARPT